MTAYNAVQGTPVSINRKMIYEVLRNEWGFKVSVIADLKAGNTGKTPVISANALWFC